ncbi:MAG: CBS domain-containing protein [Dehalococcoidia bacterium]
MLVRDIMTTNVVTVSSNKPILDARRVMETHNVRRLPVVDKGKLVGMVSKNQTQRAAPTEATSLSIWEINYLMAKMTVKDIMQKDPITVTPGITVECAAATAQKHGVGALPVVEDKLVVGILTTNDFFYKILNPLLGIGERGKRIIIYGADSAEQVINVMDVLKETNVVIKAMHTVAVHEDGSRDLIVHLDTESAIDLLVKLKEIGFHANEREYEPC